MMSFGEIVKEQRQVRGWVLRELKEALGAQVGECYLLKIERHDAIPSKKVIESIAKLFKLDVNKLFEIAIETKVKVYRDSLEKKYY